MVLRTKPITGDEFDRFIKLPENVDLKFELIAGEIVEKMVSSPRSSAIGAFLAGLLAGHVRQHDLGRVTGADGGYVVGKEKYIPDAAFISKLRQPVQPNDAYNPLPPDLAVEVLSPSDDDDDIRIKVANYIAVGTVVWVFDPDKKRVEVYRNGQPPKVLGINDTLDSGDILPGFVVAVKDIFAD
jgi:Uma2 family endonuclease